MGQKEWTLKIIPVILAMFIITALFTFTPPGRAFAASNWDQVVAKAKKEGKVVMYSTMDTKFTVPAVIKGMKEKYGITVVNMRMHPRESVAKIKAETAAKTYQVDVVGAGPGSILDYLEYFVDPGALPELNDPSVQWKINVRAYDKITLLAIGNIGISFNTKLVKPGTEPKSYKDLADPKYKGKLVMDDPRRSSILGNMFAYLTPIYGREWMKTVLIDNEPIIAREIRTVPTQLIRGEFEIYVGSLYRSIRMMLNKTPSLPVKWYYGEEGCYGSVNGLELSKNAPHPNAAKVFINYMLSQAGQEAIGIGYNIPIRIGTKVPKPEELDPARIKFLEPTPPPVEFVKNEVAKARAMAKEIMAKK